MGRSNGGSKSAAVLALSCCTMLITMLPEVSAKRFIVGGNMGWTSNVDYGLWVGNQTFYLGDWLFFVYDRNKDIVVEVNKTNYETCNGAHPIKNYTMGAGRDVVPLNVTHDRYFISVDKSCNEGMKLHVHLTPLAPPVHLAPSPSPQHLAPLAPPVYLTPLPQPPQAALSKSRASKFYDVEIQILIPVVVTIAGYMGLATSSCLL
ncbi:hypothetical protein SSX86_014528 [Deinandra increscens subsp. villosa]|uniref:Phytocyanin domain-containing protein n=1 Tax=Deinandra increscens subsp. villosa TaxID=3103831 RepID=A0AAP0D7B4_9ASTR